MTTGPEHAQEAVDTPDAVHEDTVHEEAVHEEPERQGSEDAGGREGMTPREQASGADAIRIPVQSAGLVSAGTRDDEPGAMAGGPPDSDVSDTAGSEDVGGPLLTEGEELRASWQRLMSEFVDDPRGSVAKAASMVEETAGTLVATIQERERLLRSAWEGNGTAADTENLRIALRKYRQFFEKITSL